MRDESGFAAQWEWCAGLWAMGAEAGTPLGWGGGWALEDKVSSQPA